MAHSHIKSRFGSSCRIGFLLASVCVLAIGASGCSASGRRAQTGTIRAPDGVRISYTSEGAGDVALVFVHGWTCDRTHWRFQVPAFRDSFRVITIDLPGHGDSGSNRASWSIDGLGADVAHVVRALDLTDVVLVGHSMGGPVSLAAAPRLRGVLRGIVPVDSVHNVEFVAPPGAGDRFVKRFEDDFDGAWARFMTSFFTEPKSEVLRSILEPPTAVDRRAAMGLLVSYNEIDWAGALANTGVPVRAINAAKPYPTAIEANRRHGDFDAVLMEGVGHFLMMEKPGEFNQHLRRVVDGMVVASNRGQ